MDEYSWVVIRDFTLHSSCYLPFTLVSLHPCFSSKPLLTLFNFNAMFAPTDKTVTLLLTAAILYAVRLLWGRKSTSHPLPPGPRPWPVLGNFVDLPPAGVQEWQFWLDHKEKYGQYARMCYFCWPGYILKCFCEGPISSVTTFGTTIVLLHSPELAFELLERRAAKHSSRPHMIFSGEM